MELIVFPPTYGEPAGSPFATKAIAMMELAGLDYSLTYLSNPSKMPKSKLPVLKVGDQLIPDSNEIRAYIETAFEFDFDAGLTKHQRAMSTAIIRMVEEHIYFIIYASRWIEEHNWQITRAANFSDIPPLLRGLITRMIRKGAIAQVKSQGMGRHSVSERLNRFQQDIDAIETLLGDQNYLFGDLPKAADISTITALSFARAFTGPNELNDYLATKPLLNAYLDRGRQALYPT